MPRQEPRPFALGDAACLIIGSDGLKASGLVTGYHPARYEGATITVDGEDHSIGGYKPKLVAVSADEHEQEVEVNGLRDWADVVERKLGYTLPHLDRSARERITALFGEIDAICEGGIEMADSTGGLSYKSFQGMWGNHELTLQDCLQKRTKELFEKACRR